MSRPRPLTRQPQSHHLHQIAPLLDHFFILYLLSILVDLITCFDILYSGIGCITWSSHSNIYISFCFILGIFFSISLTHYSFVFWIMWFLLYDSDSMSLKRYHFLPLFTIALATLRAMLILVGRRVKEGSFFNNARLFC